MGQHQMQKATLRVAFQLAYSAHARGGSARVVGIQGAGNGWPVTYRVYPTVLFALTSVLLKVLTNPLPYCF
jgi:hypothetical protein